MSKKIETFELKNIKVVFEETSTEYVIDVYKQDLKIPNDWEYNKVLHDRILVLLW
jgi:hypothetical protein